MSGMVSSKLVVLFWVSVDWSVGICCSLLLVLYRDGPSNTPGVECENSPLAEIHSRSFFSLEGISELHELIFC